MARGEDLPSDELTQVRRLLTERRDVMALVRTAAQRPICVFQRNWSLGPNLLLSEYGPIRDGVRMLTVESLLLAHDGRYQASIANQSLGLRIAEHAGGEPSTISFLVGVACRAITLAGFERILLQAGPNPEVAEAVRRRLAESPARFRLRPALGSEIVMSNILGRKTRRDVSRHGSRALDLAINGTAKEDASSTPDLPPIVDRKLSSGEERQVRELLEACEADWVGRLRRLVALQSKPPQVRLPLEHELELTRAQVWDDPTLLISAILLPVVRQADERGVMLQARSEVLTGAAALLTYKSRHGAFPERMESALPKLPSDPFTGRSLRYRREGQGFVLYSVGPTAMFDGGRPDGKQPKDQAFFRYPAPPAPPSGGA
jgi:hypothetical protein